MILYNVTINVEDEIHDDWLDWMQHVHFADVMATGCFQSYKFFKLLTRQADESGTTYCAQYFADTHHDYERYRDTYAPALQEKTASRYGGKFYAFRTLLEELI